MITVGAIIGKKKTAVGEKRDDAIFLGDNILRKSANTERGYRPGRLRRWAAVRGTLGSRVSAAGDKEVRAFFAAHPDSQILAGLATPDEVRILPFDPAMGNMGRAIDRPFDDFISPRGVIAVQKANPGGNLIAVGKIEGRPGAFDDNSVGVGSEIGQ